MNDTQGGKTVREYLQAEACALEAKYTQFAKLIPSTRSKSNGDLRDGSDHHAEDGRFVESLLREAIQRLLPKGLEVFAGFIVRPAVKYGKDKKDRIGGKDLHSTQLDIIVFDSTHYPVFYRSGETAIVPPEGVVAIISVKKTLTLNHVKDEAEALYKVSKLCKYSNGKSLVRGPFLALLAMDSSIDLSKSTEPVYNAIAEAYKNKNDVYFDDAIGYIGVLPKWSVFKKRPKTTAKSAEYLHMFHGDNEYHLSLQFIITGIMSVFYDESRTIIRPGYTAFHKGNQPSFKLDICGLR